MVAGGSIGFPGHGAAGPAGRRGPRGRPAGAPGAGHRDRVPLGPGRRRARSGRVRRASTWWSTWPGSDFDTAVDDPRREEIVSSRVDDHRNARPCAGRPGGHAGGRRLLAQASGVAHYGTGPDRAAAHRGLPRRERLPRPGHRGGGSARPRRRPRPASGWCDSHRPGARPQRRLVPADEAGLVARRGGEAGRRSASGCRWSAWRTISASCSGRPATRQLRPVQRDDPGADHQRRVHRGVGPGATSALLLAAPQAVLRRVLGEQAEQLLGDMYIVPQRLTEQGSLRCARRDRTVAIALAKD